MKAKTLATLLVASSAALAAPAFASGYGPAPYYRPDAGAPASQRGQSAQTLAVEQGQSGMADETQGAVGGDDMMGTRMQSGRRGPVDTVDPLDRGG
ncbi:hypothetical protein J8I87_08085 [Paraburkholderia sp. LEh10]|uniref:hypothetical protein n=1 Tax=Paraburkholderia sp. LEh10 TaxID=2821353 RepID=UPI001AE8234E|nr:hypothetical protein [Paraburkholderia sp. LEh10]MBP0589676.1 hypothetical protein [Paraburkholderia sp. LEh10]